MKTKMDFERKKFQKSEDQMNSKNFTKGNGSVNSKKKNQKKNFGKFQKMKKKIQNDFKTRKKD